MTRLIDADALIFELEKWKKNPNNDDSAVDLVNHFIGIIRATPSAEAVQVVRCKDCKHVGTDATCFLVCNRDGMGLRPYHVYNDDFCSYGERRKDGEE